MYQILSYEVRIGLERQGFYTVRLRVQKLIAQKRNKEFRIHVQICIFYQFIWKKGGFSKWPDTSNWFFIYSFDKCHQISFKIQALSWDLSWICNYSAAVLIYTVTCRKVTAVWIFLIISLVSNFNRHNCPILGFQICDRYHTVLPSSAHDTHH